MTIEVDIRSAVSGGGGTNTDIQRSQVTAVLTAGASRSCGLYGGTDLLGDNDAVKVPMSRACTIKKLYFFVETNTDTTARTFTVRKNNVNTTLALTTVGSTTGLYEDNVDEISFAAGDFFTITLSGVVGVIVGSIGVEVDYS